MCDIATFFAAVSGIVGLKKSKDASKERKALRQQQTEEANARKSEADTELRDERRGTMRSRSRSKASYAPVPDSFFGPRSFFSV